MNITKGNWYAVENDYYIDIKVDGNPIAQVIENEFVDTDKDVMRANAKLMECAPDMCEMLETIMNILNGDDALNEVSASDIDKLLAKVRGEK